ncbi:fumarylacetoacetate hydrolase family protein [Paraburkholderia sediminicola]|uniref:fumarylacetoacetate hydrolase family protein n=1 Tax=Paraburkholderia sediminicola TaxID=458836 RepID=UPI0038BA8F4C
MKILSYLRDNKPALAASLGNEWFDITHRVGGDTPVRDVAELLQIPSWEDRVRRATDGAQTIDADLVSLLPPIRHGEKILCVGLNYLAHTAESPYPQPDYPTFFARFASTLIAHDQHIVRPKVSHELDFEGELVAVIGTEGRHIPAEKALDYVAGYTIFNEASVRNYQFKAPQWTMGKNFDDTGACGPWFVSADELPRGGAGLQLSTKVNGIVEQDANTDDMVFDVATLISLASQVMTLRPGDMIVSGTPAGVRFGRKPPSYLVAGDICEITIQGIGTLRNTVRDEEETA